MAAYTHKAFRARDFRNAMTGPEVILWSRLKTLRAKGFHIRRQAPFRGYYLDFACLQRRIVIEVDGGHHGEDAQAAHDKVRDRVLEREGFRVLALGTAMFAKTSTTCCIRSWRRWKAGIRRRSPHPTVASLQPPSP